ncbi:hypothetical protein [Winogradskyella sp.]|uniref:hypothetical protein n=1 Tax=Winogradskyella sp. TaxID=1883156 RepID=UPI00263039E8|nr:hypothetical protein [Winogradskyella sp.]
MDSIAYMINRKFILVAVDTNYETQLGDISLKMNRAKKVYKLNNNNLIAVIGNPYKITDIYKYVLKLSELGHNESYEKIIEDLNNVFNSSKIKIVDGMKELTTLLPKFYNETGHIKTDELFEHLKEKPELISILKDTISSINNDMPALTQVMVFSWIPEKIKTSFAHLISLGQNLTGNELNEINPEMIYTRLSSSTVKPTETTKIENELNKKISPLLYPNWYNDLEGVQNIINKGKEILADGLKRISPYSTEPNVVFYELSNMTNFIFVEPKLKLKKIEYNRSK